MSKKCVAFSKSKLGLEKPDNRKAFYAGWEAAMREALAKQQDKPEECADGCPENTVCDYCQRAEPVKQKPVAYIRKDQLQRAMKYPCLCEVSPEPRSDRVEIYAAPVDVKAIRAEAFKEAAKVVAAVWGYVKAEPVKQEVYPCPTCGKYQSNSFSCGHSQFVESAPVDAKAIRADREWNDLADDEIREVLIKFNRGSAKFDPLEDFRAVIAAFKEKNK